MSKIKVQSWKYVYFLGQYFKVNNSNGVHLLY